MRDPIIREALHKKVLRKHHEDNNTIVLDEFGINHGAIRADIAVLNGILHGYEIKGSYDNLDRLPTQAAAYSSIFDKVTIVLSEKHLTAALEIIPKWWGVYIAHSGKRDGLNFSSYRRAVLNKTIDTEKLARLLWHSEAATLLENYGVAKKVLRQSRSELYKEIAKTCNVTELRNFVLCTLKSRKDWRDHLPL